MIFPSKKTFFSSVPENFLLYLSETYALMDERLQLLEKYNFWNGQFPDLGLIRKEYIDPIANAMENRLVKVLVGQRRSGKSFIMRQLMNYLITEKQVEPRQLLYVNFEFAPFCFVRNADDLLSLYQLYRKEKLPGKFIYSWMKYRTSRSGRKP